MLLGMGGKAIPHLPHSHFHSVSVTFGNTVTGPGDSEVATIMVIIPLVTL